MSETQIPVIPSAPDYIVDAARRITHFARVHGWEDWMFLGLADRIYTERLEREVHELRKQLAQLNLKALKEAANP